MAASFSSISGRVYPAWQSAFQASLEEELDVTWMILGCYLDDSWMSLG